MRNHLHRLESAYYSGDAIVHWTLSVRNRQTGWLNPVFLYRFRELMTHTGFRFGVVCPIFCLMPDHLHLIWMGLDRDSDQLLAIRHLRTTLNESLNRVGFELQDQAFDSVLKEEERLTESLRSTCEYIARNPERAELVPIDSYAEYPYSGAIVPGYPQLRPFDTDYWSELDRVVSYLRREGLRRKRKTRE